VPEDIRLVRFWRARQRLAAVERVLVERSRHRSGEPGGCRRLHPSP
jgi:hypothetical protein